MSTKDYNDGYDAGHKDGHDQGYNEGYKDGHKAGSDLADASYNKGYDVGFDAGYDEGEKVTIVEADEDTSETFTISMSSDLFTAYRTDEPGIFEQSSVSAHDALGKLVARLYTVRTLGRLAS